MHGSSFGRDVRRSRRSLSGIRLHYGIGDGAGAKKGILLSCVDELRVDFCRGPCWAAADLLRVGVSYKEGWVGLCRAAAGDGSRAQSTQHF